MINHSINSHYLEVNIMWHDYHGLIGILILILDIWAIINVVGTGRGALEKALWIVLILVLPVLGFIIWFFIGPKSSRP